MRVSERKMGQGTRREAPLNIDNMVGYALAAEHRDRVRKFVLIACVTRAAVSTFSASSTPAT